MGMLLRRHQAERDAKEVAVRKRIASDNVAAAAAERDAAEDAARARIVADAKAAAEAAELAALEEATKPTPKKK